MEKDPIHPGTFPFLKIWLECSREELLDALLSPAMPYKHAGQLISILQARFPDLVQENSAKAEFAKCPYDKNSYSNRLFQSLAEKLLDRMFVDLEDLYRQIWQHEELEHNLYSRRKGLMHDVILHWLMKYSFDKSLYVGDEYCQVSVDCDIDAVDFVSRVDDIWDEAVCDVDDEGVPIPVTPSEYLERKKRRGRADRDIREIEFKGAVEPIVKVVRPSVIAFQDETALRNFGYRVGKSSPLTEAERRDLLMDFYFLDFRTRAKRDPLYQDVGEHESGERLGYMAAVIASNIHRFFNNNPEKYECAVSHWIEDLRFLRLKFEGSNGWWPDIEVSIYNYYGYTFHIDEEIPF